MSAYQEIRTSLESLDSLRRAAFAAACAERLLPLVRTSGDADNAALYESGLEAAWRAVAARGGKREVSRLRSAVSKSLRFVDDGDSSEAHVMRALSVLDYALRAILKDETRLSKWASSELIGLRSGFDGVLERGHQPVVIDPNDPPPPGPLQAQEIEAQKETLRLIESRPEPDEELVSSLRRLSQEASRDFEAAIPEYARRMDWNLT